jgi:glycosyltransferase involved in cell wall biosynthesis
MFWLEKLSLRRADYWSSVSRYTAEKTRRLFNLRSGPDAILYNPVELAEPNHDPRDNRDVLFSGTLTEKKGVVPLFQAWPAVLRACPDARLHIYGKDRTTSAGRSMQEHLVSLLSDDELASVSFHGHVDRAELFRRLRQARLAIFPSYAEAFALAPLEAMACGCPTISSNRGAGVEMMRDGVDGLLVDPDRPEQIAEAVTNVLRDDSLAERIGDRGRKRIEECFSIDKLVAKNEAFFRRCIDQYALKET